MTLVVVFSALYDVARLNCLELVTVSFVDILRVAEQLQGRIH